MTFLKERDLSRRVWERESLEWVALDHGATSGDPDTPVGRARGLSGARGAHLGPYLGAALAQAKRVLLQNLS